VGDLGREMGKNGGARELESNGEKNDFQSLKKGEDNKQGERPSDVLEVTPTRT